MHWRASTAALLFLLLVATSFPIRSPILGQQLQSHQLADASELLSEDASKVLFDAGNPPAVAPKVVSLLGIVPSTIIGNFVVTEGPHQLYKLHLTLLL